MKHRILLLVAALALPAAAAAAPKVKITSPSGGYLATPIVTIAGTVEGNNVTWATLVYNGVSSRIAVTGNRFETKIVLSKGDGLLEVSAADAGGVGRDRVSFYANVPKWDVKIVLTWESNGTDMDLWVTDPSGERVYYGAKTSKVGGQLDIDVTTGYGPEVFTMQNAVAGTYQIQVQNYSPGNAPVTRMRVDLILYEGTDRETRKSFPVVSYKVSEVVNVVSFSIGADLAYNEK